MAKLNKYLFISVLTLSVCNILNAQSNFKELKKQIVFVDTITIETPIIISYKYKVRHKHTLYFWRKTEVVEHYISSEKYLSRLTNRKFSQDSLLLSDIAYMHTSLIVSLFRSYDNEDVVDVFSKNIIDMLSKDYKPPKRYNFFTYRWNKYNFIKTSKKGLFYAHLETSKFAVFLVREDYFTNDNPNLSRYYKVAIPIEVGNVSDGVL
jgi:hypothetical protein